MPPWPRSHPLSASHASTSRSCATSQSSTHMFDGTPVTTPQFQCGCAFKVLINVASSRIHTDGSDCQAGFLGCFPALVHVLPSWHEHIPRLTSCSVINVQPRAIHCMSAVRLLSFIWTPQLHQLQTSSTR